MTDQTIHFLPIDKRCAVKGEDSVLEVALRNDVNLSHSCGGMGSCTTCRVIVVRVEGELPPRNEMEQDVSDMYGFRQEERLACQLPPLPGLVVRVPGDDT